MPTLKDMREQGKEAGLIELDKLIAQRQHIPTCEFPAIAEDAVCRTAFRQAERDAVRGYRSGNTAASAVVVINDSIRVGGKRRRDGVGIRRRDLQAVVRQMNNAAAARVGDNGECRARFPAVGYGRARAERD